MAPEICPHCGADVPSNAKACPQCGSDEETGWSEEAVADNLGLPDEDFDYDEFIKDEFGSGRAKPRRMTWFWWGVALLILIVWLVLWF